MGGLTLARPLQLTQGAAHGLNLPLVGIFLPLRKFQRFQDFFHIIEGLLEGLDDPVDLFDGFLNPGRRRRPRLANRQRGSNRLARSRFRAGLKRFQRHVTARFLLRQPFLPRGLPRRRKRPKRATTTSTVPATRRAPASPHRLRNLRTRRPFGSDAWFFVGSHVFPQSALNRTKCNGNCAPGRSARERPERNWLDATPWFLQICGTMNGIDQLRRRLSRAVDFGFAGWFALNPAPAQQTNALRFPAPRRPNLVIILADGLGYGDLGCYGQTRIKTPNIDRMAAEGMRFTSFYAGSTAFTRSLHTLMTGLHTGHALALSNNTPTLQPDDLTLAEVLHRAGYHTALVGQWGLGGENTTGAPQRKGFDEFVGFLDQARAQDYYADHLDRYDPKYPRENRDALPENQGGNKGLYIPDLFATAALNFVRNNKPDEFNRHRSFFLCLACTTLQANAEEISRSGNGMVVPSDEPYSNEPWPQAEKNKAAMITRMDTDIGRLMDKIKELKIDDNTIIIFTSNNGPQKGGGVDPGFFLSSGPLRGSKGDLNEGGIRVPMIVRWPAKIKPGGVAGQAWAFWDVLPTAAEIAGLTPPEKSDGISLLPTLLGQTQTNHHAFLYWESQDPRRQQAVRMGDWKGVRSEPGKPLELYNLKTDPGEKQNVAEQNPLIVAEIEECLKTGK